MKALSIRQPWAYLIVAGYKDVENRTWNTNFRGRIYVHAGKSPDNLDGVKSAVGILEKKLSRLGYMLAVHGIKCDVEFGGIIGEVTIIDCVQDSDSPWAVPGQYQFVLKDALRYEQPIPMTGRLGFWEVGDLACPK